MTAAQKDAAGTQAAFILCICIWHGSQTFTNFMQTTSNDTIMPVADFVGASDLSLLVPLHPDDTHSP